jgi:hypothetical protein
MAGVDSREVEAGGRRYMQHMVKGLGYAKPPFCIASAGRNVSED